jgi:uncharacterized protein (DUF736 family)
MSIIGTFTKDGTGYTGTLRTLTLDANVRIVPTEGASKKAPGFRVFVEQAQVGAAWSKISQKSKRAYLTLSLDDPSFAQPIYANLIESTDGIYELLWSRNNQEE